MDKAILAGEIPRCYRCNGPVQPDIVFFGQYLTGFEEEERKVREADLMLVMGTSLRVPPCSTLPTKVEEGVPRVLINNEKAGDLGDRNEDVCILGSCDDGVRQLADALGWGEELNGLWKEAVAAKRDSDIFGGGPSLDECIEKFASSMKGEMVSDEQQNI